MTQKSFNKPNKKCRRFINPTFFISLLTWRAMSQHFTVHYSPFPIPMARHVPTLIILSKIIDIETVGYILLVILVAFVDLAEVKVIGRQSGGGHLIYL